MEAVTARCVMVLGTSSGAGKSWLATALCRYYARQGLNVAPFKAQNMSNNARVVTGRCRGDVFEWGEIGSAQYFQALAAQTMPDVRMNPLLLKPEADTRSQVVLLGQVHPELSAMPWRGRSELVWPHIRQALDALRDCHDVVVIEGAGSPAEINLHASDIVNMRVARHAQARCLLVSDIDRGGAFAHLYGTWALLPQQERQWIHGFVLNKFRGDASLLAPAPQWLEELTGVPTVATLPMLQGHGLPEEDGVFDERTYSAGAVRLTVALLAYPRISNLDEFQVLKNLPGVRLVWARSPADLAHADWIVLPGSKYTGADLAWLRARGLDQAVAAHAQRGGAVLGICGGLQMLGEAIIDAQGIEPIESGNAPGLGLLPLITVFAADKTVRPSQGRLSVRAGPWGALDGVSVKGYEIHHGQTALHPAMVAQGRIAHEVLPGLAWQNQAGNVLGLYLHGLLENPQVLQALFGAHSPTLEQVFDRLADCVQQHTQAGVLDALIHPSIHPSVHQGADMSFSLPQVADIHQPALEQELQIKIDQKTKPPGSLGQIETLALRLASILGSATPRLQQPQMLVCAADHGLAARGVSAYPSDVTWQMVENFLAGGAAVSVLARQHGLALTVVDCGVAHDFGPRPGLLVRKVAYGTADASTAPAMTAQQCQQALNNGVEVVRQLPGNVLLLGEMGIGNTSAASLLLARLCALDIADCTGSGTGLDAPGVQRKVGVLRAVLQRHAGATEPLDALAALGGLEIATLTGAVLQAAAERRVLVVDGFITTAAVLVAARLQPAVLQRCVYAHRSGERGHALMLAALQAQPLLDLGLRLGEGSGAALAWPLLQSAEVILNQMASFESAGVSQNHTSKIQEFG